MDQVYERYPITKEIVDRKMATLVKEEQEVIPVIEEISEPTVKKVKAKKNEKVPTKKVPRGVRSKRS
jgi:hypothetical protein